jgi:hypothetical protein
MHRRVTTLTFAIKTQAVPNCDSIASANIVNSGRGKVESGEPSGAVSFKIWELICEILLFDNLRASVRIRSCSGPRT